MRPSCSGSEDAGADAADEPGGAGAPRWASDCAAAAGFHQISLAKAGLDAWPLGCKGWSSTNCADLHKHKAYLTGEP